MKYTSEIIIEVPLSQFIKKYDSHENRKLWQKGLESSEHISGEPGKIGAKMKMTYSIGNRKLSLIETITENKLPYELHAHYDTKGMHNIQENYFEETPEGHTKWTCKNEFIATSFFIHAMTLLSPKSFKKQTMAYLTNFKKFAEDGILTNHA